MKTALAQTPQALLFELTTAQMDQQIDLALRMLRMAHLGTPRVQSPDPLAPDLLVLHALITAYQAVASANPAVAQTAAYVAHSAADTLRQIADQYAATAH